MDIYIVDNFKGVCLKLILLAFSLFFRKYELYWTLIFWSNKWLIIQAFSSKNYIGKIDDYSNITKYLKKLEKVDTIKSLIYKIRKLLDSDNFN